MDYRKSRRAALGVLVRGIFVLGALASASPTFAWGHGRGHKGYWGIHSHHRDHVMNCATYRVTRWTFWGPVAGWSNEC